MSDERLEFSIGRTRWGWRAGYFDDLVGQRIPLPDPQGRAIAGRFPDARAPLVGRLVDVAETERRIAFVFEDVEPEGE